MIVTFLVPRPPYDDTVPHEVGDYPPIGVSYDRVDYAFAGDHVPRVGDSIDLQGAPAGINPRTAWTVGKVSWICNLHGCKVVEVFLK